MKPQLCSNQLCPCRTDGAVDREGRPAKGMRVSGYVMPECRLPRHRGKCGNRKDKRK